MTAFESLLDRLRDNQKVVRLRGRGKAMAQCPAHEDRNPSLSIRRFPQRIRVKCFAGCTDEAVLAALNLRCPDDLFDNPNGASYSYADGWKVHWPPNKQIWVEGPDTNGQRRALYRLDEVIARKEAGKVIYLVEGEPDADAVFEEGAVGTSGRGGADSFHLTDVTPLYGAEIIAVVDQPTKPGDKTGERWARQVLAKLDGKAKSLDFVKAKTGKDLSDHLTAGYSLDELVPWGRPPESEPPNDVPPHEEPKSERSSWWPVDLGPVLRGGFERPQPTVGRRTDGRGILYRKRSHTVIGETESAKTWFALSAAARRTGRRPSRSLPRL